MRAFATCDLVAKVLQWLLLASASSQFTFVLLAAFSLAAG